jgi:hypothetical protein
VAELVVRLGEEDRFIDAGDVFKGDELHGVAVPGLYGLAGDDKFTQKNPTFKISILPS